MFKFTIISDNYLGKEFYHKCETEQEFLNWAATKPHLGKKNWSKPKYLDDNDVEQFPIGFEPDANGAPIPVIVNHPEAIGTDMDGNPVVIPAWDETQYKMPDQWSFTVEDITVETDRRARLAIAKAKAQKHTLITNFCKFDLVGIMGANNDAKNLTTVQRNTLMTQPEIAAMLDCAEVGFLSKIEELLSGYTPDETLFTSADKAELQQLIADFKLENNL